MSFLHHFFADDRALSEELARDEQLLRASILRYQKAVQRRQEIKAALDAGAPVREQLFKLQSVLADELALIEGAQKTEEEIVTDLDALKHEEHAREWRKLVLSMDHAASRERFIQHAMRQLHELLLDEAHTLTALRANPDEERLRQTLLHQLTLEQEMAERLGEAGELIGLYRSLALGARRKHEIEEHEQAIAQEIYERMNEYEQQESGELAALSEHSITLLCVECSNRLKEEVDDAVASGTLDKHYEHHFEFVNSPHFERFVREQARNYVDLNEDELRIFIHIFREMYNTYIESHL